MKDYHPSPDLLKRFMCSTLDAAESRRVVRHLLTGCPACQKMTGNLWRASAEPGAGPAGLHCRRYRR